MVWIRRDLSKTVVFDGARWANEGRSTKSETIRLSLMECNVIGSFVRVNLLCFISPIEIL